MSATGVGYEQNAYVWVGYGVWTQLWASLTLPLAWGFSWRALHEGRNFFAAVVLVSLTVALHFETGYLALMPLLAWPLVTSAPITLRVRRAAVLLVSSLLACAWVIVPLIEDRTWAATNEFLGGTPLVNGYGAARVLGWFVSGQLLDAGRIPVVTLFALIGLALACVSCRTDENARALLVVFAACVLLSFGRTTFGSLVDVIPGSRDLFFRRFMMGIQLAALLFAGPAAVWCLRSARKVLDRWLAGRGLTWLARTHARSLGRSAIAFGGALLVLAPAWAQLDRYDRHDTSVIKAQVRADDSQGPQLDRLIAVVEREGAGRVYAGTPSNWGQDFTVEAVPVFKYLESKDVDEVGYTLRTASLMTPPEYYFDERNPGDYSLFGIHYLILPREHPPPIAARLVICEDVYCLWTVGSTGYVHVGRIVGELTANRMNVGFRSSPLLHSHLAQQGDYLEVAFGQRPAARSLPLVERQVAVGNVISESDKLDQGYVAATVRMSRPGVAVLSASFDPGWTATVDGHPRTPHMVAPALVAIHLREGTHRIVFRYVGFPDYLELFALTGLSLFGLLVADLMRWQRRRATVSAQPSTSGEVKV